MLAAIRTAFDGDDAAEKNVQLRRAHDLIAKLQHENAEMRRTFGSHPLFEEMRELLELTLPALERHHATLAGGPKKSDALHLLNRVRAVSER